MKNIDNILVTASLCFVLNALISCDRAANTPPRHADNPPVTAEPKPVVIEPGPINLRNFPRMNQQEPLMMSSTQVSYHTDVDATAAYEFQKAAFLKLGWREEPGAAVSAKMASGAFSGAGYRISVSVHFQAGGLIVLLLNHGTAELGKLPLPPGSKSLFIGPVSAMSVKETSVEDATEFVQTALLASGWEVHGHEANSYHFKQALNRISVTLQAAPAQGGRTVITYTSELLAGDLPVLPDGREVRYVGPRQEVIFQTATPTPGIVEFYKSTLGKTGWTPNQPTLMSINDYEQMVFRTSSDDVNILQIRKAAGMNHNVSLSFSSAAEMAAAFKKADDEGAAQRAKTIN
jgi:hypothetical protein